MIASDQSTPLMRTRYFFYCLKAGSLQLLLVVAAILLLCQGAMWLQSSVFGVGWDEASVAEDRHDNALVLAWSVFSGNESVPVEEGEGDIIDTGRDEASEGMAWASIPTQSVLHVVWERTLNSLWVIGLAMTAMLGLGVPLGILRGRSRRNPLAWLLAMPSAVGVCLPVYWLAAVSAWWMMDHQGIPLPGVQSAELGVAVVAPEASWMVDRWPGFLLAGLIALSGTGWLVRSVSGAIQRAAEADHLWVGRMRGMRESRLFHRHTLRNALRPLVLSVADLLPFVIGGLVLGEGVLGFSGLGGLVFESGIRQDFAVLLPATLVLAVLVLAVRSTGWIVAGWLEPHVDGEVELLS